MYKVATGDNTEKWTMGGQCMCVCSTGGDFASKEAKNGRQGGANDNGGNEAVSMVQAYTKGSK